MSTEETTARGPYPWILGPFVDYIFVSGGAVWLMIAVNYLAIGMEIPADKEQPHHLGLLVFAYTCQHLIFNSHNVATYLRLWGSEEDRSQYKFYRTTLFYAAILVLALALYNGAITGTLAFLYMVLVFWHFCMQMYGISLIYCLKRNYLLADMEREVFRAFMLSLSAYVVLRFITVQDFYPDLFYGVPRPFWIPFKDPIATLAFQFSWIASLALGTGFALIVLKKIFRDRKLLPLPVIVMLLTIVALACSSGKLNALLWFYVPCLYHASQYLVLNLSYFLKERGLSAGMDPWEISKESRSWEALRYYGKLALLGTVLYIFIPHCCDLIGGANFQDTAGLVFALVNFHQFVTDAAMWRLRDDRTRRILVA